MITTLVTPDQAKFYREFLMGRGRFNPNEFGVEMARDEFMDQMVDDFNLAFGESLTVDELLLHPRTALRFCDDVRHKHRYHDAPDDIILRSVMTRRKNPN